MKANSKQPSVASESFFLTQSIKLVGMYLLLSLFLVLSARPDIVVRKDTFIDTANKLEWFKVNLTTNISFLEMEENFATAGNQFFGYKYATEDEIKAMWKEFNLISGIENDQDDVVHYLNSTGRTGRLNGDNQVGTYFAFINVPTPSTIGCVVQADMIFNRPENAFLGQFLDQPNGRNRGIGNMINRAVEIRTAPEITLVIKEGWNLISTDKRILGSTLLELLVGKTIGSIWEWEKDKFNVATNLLPSRGYWIYSMDAIDIELVLN